MIEYIIWIVSFLTLYLSIVLISFLYLGKEIQRTKVKNPPTITIAVPVYNEEKSIIETLRSLVSINYPKNKLEIMVIDDKSTDNTVKIVKEFIAGAKANITLIRKPKNEGKGAALNTALRKTKSEYFGCVDADTIIDKDALKTMLPNFSKTTAAVITAIRIYKPKTLYEHLQRLEYIITILSRKIMTSIKTLFLTPGALSLYNTTVLRKIGEFDGNRENITEDFEIGLRLKKHGYDIVMSPESYSFTKAPKTFKELWSQRIRWYRGFLYNTYRYKSMFFNKKYGLVGMYQLPLNVLGIPLLIFVISLGLIVGIKHLYETTIRSWFIKNYFLEQLLNIPNIKELILSMNLKIMIPIIFSFLLALFIFFKAHRFMKEKLNYPVTIYLYITLFPILTCMHWVAALSQELTKTKRKW